MHVLSYLGGGIAPWNVQQYSFTQNKNGLSGVELETGKKFDVVFYHFHHLKFLSYEVIDLGSYRLTQQIVSLFISLILSIYKRSPRK